MSEPRLTIIVPTFREAENLPRLLEQIDSVRRELGLDMELLVMDDDSRDGTDRLIAAADHDWVHLHVRTGQRSLSAAVLDGIKLARGQIIVVMDADLSHPPQRLGDMVKAIDDGADFVIGSRYMHGGSTDADWGLLRRLNSRIASLMARPFTRVRDPMSGFIAFPRRILDRGGNLNPVGYKIGLELLVKCDCRDVREVPIHFADRTLGHSKLTLAEQLRYMQHIRRLALYKYPNASCLMQFVVVGASGVVVNLAVLTLLYNLLGVRETIAIAVAIVVSVVSNFFLNRRFTFGYARGGSLLKQFLGFAGASALGAIVNYSVAILALAYAPGVTVPQVAALLGIASGMVINFLVNRLFVFRRTGRA
ncbi:MAG: glycosyltransferase family 2 protein [Phycisphaeraceae bacterium]|nr:glycosyltransferase family 2 protein [Phycisphaeraceae bacterium]